VTSDSKSKNKHDELLPARRSLIERLRDLGDQPSWLEFFDTYWRQI
jgi:hypothetical protein